MVRFTYCLSQSNPIFHLCIFSFGVLRDLSTNISHKSYKELDVCTCTCVCTYARLLEKVLIKEESHHSYSSDPSSRSLPSLQALGYVLTYSSSTSSIDTCRDFHNLFMFSRSLFVGSIFYAKYCSSRKADFE